MTDQASYAQRNQKLQDAWQVFLYQYAVYSARTVTGTSRAIRHNHTQNAQNTPIPIPQSLVGLNQAQQKQHFSAAFQTLFAHACAIARSLKLDTDEAEEYAQNSLVRIIENISKHPPEKLQEFFSFASIHIHGYLRKAIKNVFLDFMDHQDVKNKAESAIRIYLDEQIIADQQDLDLDLITELKRIKEAEGGINAYLERIRQFILDCVIDEYAPNYRAAAVTDAKIIFKNYALSEHDMSIRALFRLRDQDQIDLLQYEGTLAGYQQAISRAKKRLIEKLEQAHQSSRISHEAYQRCKYILTFILVDF